MSRRTLVRRVTGAAMAGALSVAAAGCSQAPAPLVVDQPVPPRATAPLPAAPAPLPVARPAPRPSAAAPRPSFVTAAPGDTLYALSRRFDVPIRDLIAANRLAPPYLLRVGQRVELPQSRYHTVQKGETAYAISRLYDVDLHSLMRLNKVPEPYTIAVGQRLLLPGTTTAVSAPPVAVTAVAPPPAAETTAPPTPTPRPATSAAPPSPPASPPASPPPSAEPSPPSPRELAQVPMAPPRAGSSFAWPVEGKVISRFGPKSGGRHNDGINIAAAQGTPLRAAENGVVAYAGNELKGFGNLLLLRHADGWSTAYAHAETLLVHRGETVRRGQIVGRVGSTGSVDRPQLHFEIRRGTKAVDPLNKLELKTSGELSAPGLRRAGPPGLG